MERAGLIQERLIAKGQNHYRLTGKGYCEALKSNGSYDPELQDRLGRFSAELKRYVKDRSQEAVLFPAELATNSAFSENWIKNVIEAELIQSCLNRRGASLEDKGNVVVIPVDFGHELG